MHQNSGPVYLSRGHLMLAASKARHQNPPQACTLSNIITCQQSQNAQAENRIAKIYSGGEGSTSVVQSHGRKERMQGNNPDVFEPTLNRIKPGGNEGKRRQHHESRSQIRQGCVQSSCLVCGKNAATQSCDRCELMSFCQQCFVLWHSHPGRQNHKPRHHKPKQDENEDKVSESESSTDASNSASIRTVTSAPAALPIQQTVVAKATKKKISRPCIFCGKCQTNLSRHILLIHNDKEEVQELTRQSKTDKCRLLQKFKRQGILEYNKQQMKLLSPNYQRERMMKSVDSAFTVCEHCSGCFSKKTFYAHKARCKAESNRPKPRPISFPLLSLPSIYKGTAFEEDVLSTIRDDEIGRICKTDTTVLLVGKRMFDKEGSCADRKMQATKSAKTHMRRLAALFLHFRQEASLTSSGMHENISEVSDMLNVLNMDILERALNAYTTEEECIKAGLKESLFWLLLKTADAVKAMFLRKGQKEKVQTVDDFVVCFKHEERSLFGHARTIIKDRREKCLRKPENMPNKEEVGNVHSYIDLEIARLTDNYAFWSSSEYLLLRDLLITQITIFNGRRGGEPARLLMHQWEEALNDEWLMSESTDATEKHERDIHGTKIAYQRGKGGHLVPIIFLGHVVKALQKFCDEDVRRSAGVNPNNKFVFPATGDSLNCADGWHAVHDTVCKVGLPSERAKLFTATKMRHYVSTVFAQIDTPESTKQLFFKHMGHSMRTNLNSYQAPLAKMTMNGITPLLLNMKESNVLGKRDAGASSTSANLASSLESISPTQVEEDCSAASSPADDMDFPSDMESASSSEEPDVIRKKGKRRRRAYLRWSKGETDTIRDYFKSWFNAEKNPGKAVIEKFKELHPQYTQPWQSIRTKIINDKSNEMRRADRRMQQMLQ